MDFPLGAVNRKAISRRLFLPKFYDWIFNPLFLIRRPIYKNLALYSKDVSGVVLDFGCGSMPYRPLFRGAETYIGVDLRDSLHSLSSPDIFFEGERVPLPDSSCDWILMFEVLDDLPHPLNQMAEIKRLLKPGGKLLATSSFVWELHEEPADFSRFTVHGISALLQNAGFVGIEISKLGASQRVIGQLAAMYWYQILQRLPIFGMPLAALCSGLINGATLLLERATPLRSELYLTNLFVASKSEF